MPQKQQTSVISCVALPDLFVSEQCLTMQQFGLILWLEKCRFNRTCCSDSDSDSEWVPSAICAALFCIWIGAGLCECAIVLGFAGERIHNWIGWYCCEWFIDWMGALGQEITTPTHGYESIDGVSLQFDKHVSYCSTLDKFLAPKCTCCLFFETQCVHAKACSRM